LYYAPNNATLVIVGDIDKEKTRDLVRKYFGDLTRGSPIERPTVGAHNLTGEKRLTLEDRVQVPQLTITYPTVSVRNENLQALQLMTSILSGSRVARLTKTLVYDKQIATNAFAFNQ